jgi:hypothetical protein
MINAVPFAVQDVLQNLKVSNDHALVVQKKLNSKLSVGIIRNALRRFRSSAKQILAAKQLNTRKL